MQHYIGMQATRALASICQLAGCPRWQPNTGAHHHAHAGGIFQCCVVQRLRAELGQVCQRGIQLHLVLRAETMLPPVQCCSVKRRAQ